jgi:hypothetical protein
MTLPPTVITTDQRVQRLWSLLRGNLVVPVISVHLLCTAPAWCQRLNSTLGPVAELELAYAPAGLAALHSPGSTRAEIAVLRQEPGEIHLFKLAPTGELMTTRMLPLEGAAAPVIVAVDLNGDGKDDIVTLSSAPAGVILHTRTAAGFERLVLPLGSTAEACTIADINNDRRADILLFGKNTSGVRSFLRQANGSYAEGPPLFPDISVSDLVAADLNADNITDIVLADWLSDQLVTFYGIGRGVFSEQVAEKLDGEPTHLALTPLTRDRRFGVAVALAGRSSVLVYEGDASGNLTLLETLTYAQPARGIALARLTAGRLPELVTVTHSSISVSSGVALHTFSSPVAFGMGRDLAGFAVADVDGDRFDDVVCADGRSRRLVCIGSAHGTGTTAWPSAYAVGMDPRGLAVRDVTGDGIEDIIVANRGSGHLSLLRGRGEGRFQGQEAMMVPPQPVRVLAIGSPFAPVHTLIASHEDGDNVTIVRFEPDSNRYGTTAVPTGARPYVALAKQDSSGATLEMLVRYEHGRDRSLSLSLFEQTGARQFIERSLRPSVAGRVVALTVGDVLRNGLYDLVFATRERSEGLCALSLAKSESGFDFRSVSRLLTFADTGGTTHSLATGFVNPDDHKDILVLSGAPRNAIGILYGNGDGVFRDSLEWIRNIRPLDEDVVLLRDLDGDGLRDIAFLDERREAAVAVYQRAEGGFQQPVVVCPAKGATGIRIASFRNPREQDLVLAWGEKGTVSVTFDAFRK